MKPVSLHERILAALHETGPATVGQLASNLSESLGMVLFALERLRDTDKHIRVLPGGLWDVTEEYRKGRSEEIKL
jgi:DNA-binding transcriptional ArsR family regulator